MQRWNFLDIKILEWNFLQKKSLKTGVGFFPIETNSQASGLEFSQIKHCQVPGMKFCSIKKFLTAVPFTDRRDAISQTKQIQVFFNRNKNQNSGKRFFDKQLEPRDGIIVGMAFFPQKKKQHTPGLEYFPNRTREETWIVRFQGWNFVPQKKF